MAFTSRGIIKFNGTGYGSWANKMKGSLQEIYLWKYVSGKAFRPRDPIDPLDVDAADTRALEAWIMNDKAAKIFLEDGTEDAIVREIESLDTAMARWDRLKAKYEPKEIVMALYKTVCKTDFHGRTVDELIQHFNDMINANARLGLQKMALPDPILAMYMITSVSHRGSSWEVVELQALNLETDEAKLSPMMVRDFYISRVSFSRLLDFASGTQSTSGTPQSQHPNPKVGC